MKRISFLICFLSLFISLATNVVAFGPVTNPTNRLESTVKATGKDSETSLNSIDCLVSNILTYAEQYIGVPYRSGGVSGNGFDCSGFTSTVFREFGVPMPRTTNGQAVLGIDVDLSETKPGDLLFFKGRNSASNRIGHVALVTETKEGDIRFIHASVSKGITIDSINQTYYKERIIKAKRLFY